MGTAYVALPVEHIDVITYGTSTMGYAFLLVPYITMKHVCVRLRTRRRRPEKNSVVCTYDMILRFVLARRQVQLRLSARRLAHLRAQLHELGAIHHARYRLRHHMLLETETTFIYPR